LIVCPSCGSKVDGDLCLGCVSCGARAIGPPLAKAEHQLRSYGRAAIASASGAAMAVGFLGLVTTTLIQFKGFPFHPSSILSAGEVAAWRLKWVALPIAIAVLWSSARIVQSIRKNPERFVGLRAARAGFAASIVATLMVVTLIGITVPERLRRHQWGVEAGINARGYTLARALMEYRALSGTLPSQENLVKELSTLPDPDGSIAEALSHIDPAGYQASTMLAAASTKSKVLVPRGGAIRNASAVIDPATDRGVSFTSYELRLSPGEDKIPNTDDDLVMADGIIMTVSELRLSSKTSSIQRAP
jgi:hypothetical protein